MDILVTRKQQKYFGIFFAVTMVVCASIPTYQWWKWRRDPSSRPKPELSLLNEEFNQIPIPGPIKERKVYDRPGITGVGGYFLSELSPSESVSSVRSYAQEKGWLFYRSKDAPVLSVTLCKRGTAFSISSIPWQTGSQTSISLTWTFHTAALNYCPSDDSINKNQ